MKRLVICCDGTWNAPFDDTPSTNVQRIAELVKPVTTRSGGTEEIQQIVYYDSGVGTSHDAVSGGVVGLGLDENIWQAYQFLVENYRPGDEIYCFGFSRGAYTVRSLLGLIELCGILRKQGEVGSAWRCDDDAIKSAYEYYRLKNSLSKLNTAEAKSVYFPESRSHRRVPITFLGVFDTVGSLGIPDFISGQIDAERYSFHDITLGPHVIKARHALAMDEHRTDFQPCPWIPYYEAHPEGKETLAFLTDSEQRWFVGDHCDVGGSHGKKGIYKDADTAELSKLANDLSKAKTAVEAAAIQARADQNHRLLLSQRATAEHQAELADRGLSNITLRWMLNESGLDYYSNILEARYPVNPNGKIHNQLKESSYAAIYGMRQKVYRHICARETGPLPFHHLIQAKDQTYSWTLHWGKKQTLCDMSDTTLSPEARDRIEHDPSYIPSAMIDPRLRATLSEAARAKLLAGNPWQQALDPTLERFERPSVPTATP